MSEKKEIVITGSKVVLVVLGLAFVVNIVATILLALSGDPFLPELSFIPVITHPLVLTVLMGIMFFADLASIVRKKR